MVLEYSTSALWTPLQERVLIYLYQRGDDVALEYNKGEDAQPVVTGYSDSDFDDAHSTTGYTFKMAAGAISWLSQKQKTVALHTTEAEINAMSHAACEAMFITYIMEELGHKQTKPITIKADNTAAIAIANDPMHHKRTKHIRRRQLFVREAVADGNITLQYVRTNNNVADVFTKALPRKPFQQYRMELGLREP